MCSGRAEQNAIRDDAGAASADFQHPQEQGEEQQLSLFGLAELEQVGGNNVVVQTALNGGFARIRLYLSLSGFWSLRLSRYSMNGLSTPWVIMFIAPMRSMVRSISKPWNMCSCSGLCFCGQRTLPACGFHADIRQRHKEARRAAGGSQITSSARGCIRSTIMRMMWRGVRN